LEVSLIVFGRYTLGYLWYEVTIGDNRLWELFWLVQEDQYIVQHTVEVVDESVIGGINPWKDWQDLKTLIKCMSFSLEIFDFLAQFIIKVSHAVITKHPTMGDPPIAFTAPDAMNWGVLKASNFLLQLFVAAL
jgi:hypothetical protein